MAKKTFVSLSELSRLTGRTESTLRRAIANGLPVEKRKPGKPWVIPLEAAREWLENRDKARGSIDPELQKQRARLTRINADRKELQLEQERGRLIRTELAQRLWGAVLFNMINKLEALPSKLAPALQGLTIPEAKAALDKAIYEVRMEMSNPDLKEIAQNMSNNKKTGGKKK